MAEAIDSREISEFCGVDSSNQAPDGDTLDRFRNLLIRNGLYEMLFAQVAAVLMERGLILRKGIIVDSTIISPSIFPQEQGGETGSGCPSGKEIGYEQAVHYHESRARKVFRPG